MKKPKLLLDENIGLLVLKLLRKQRYDVISILEVARGSKDSDVLSRAVAEDRIVVTLDKDFGKLVFANSKKHIGVIFLRPSKENSDNVFILLYAILVKYGNQLKKKFITVTESRIRIKG